MVLSQTHCPVGLTLCHIGDKCISIFDIGIFRKNANDSFSHGRKSPCESNIGRREGDSGQCSHMVGSLGTTTGKARSQAWDTNFTISSNGRFVLVWVDNFSIVKVRW